jgi:hypothetical protein
VARLRSLPLSQTWAGHRPPLQRAHEGPNLIVKGGREMAEFAERRMQLPNPCVGGVEVGALPSGSGPEPVTESGIDLFVAGRQLANDHRGLFSRNLEESRRSVEHTSHPFSGHQ